MAIDRAPWNALVDDDGTNLVGTVWNKDKIKTVILDPTDAALVAQRPAIVAPFCVGPSVQTPFVAGTYHNVRPTNGQNIVTWELYPSGAVTITGFVAEAAGTQHLLINTGLAGIVMAHQDAGSTAGNKIIGPSYGPFTLLPWNSIWVTYFAAYSSWMVLKP